MNITHSLVSRKFLPDNNSCSNICSRRLRNCKSLYRKTLFGHHGCVNTVSFSTSESAFVTSGDDGRVLLWNTAECVSDRNVQPCVEMSCKHESNVFSACFNCRDDIVFTGGNDERILVHDVVANKQLRDFVFAGMQIFCIDSHPSNPSVCVAGASTGKVFLVDSRQFSSAESQSLAAREGRSSAYDIEMLMFRDCFWSVFRCVKFHPCDPNYFVAANNSDGVTLRDVRMCNEVVSRFQHKTRFKPQQSLHRGFDTMHCCFDKTGSQLLVQAGQESALYLYDFDQPDYPKLHFSNRSYRNKTTVKSCSFMGPNDEYIASGSDDFNVYVWRIPRDGSKKHVWVPHLQLRGHRSVVNQVAYSRRFSLLASSGTEKIVKIWSPFHLNHGMGSVEEELGVTRKRLYNYNDYLNFVINDGIIDQQDFRHQSTEEDPRVLALFDIEGAGSGSEDYQDNYPFPSTAVLSSVPPVFDYLDHEGDDDLGEGRGHRLVNHTDWDSSNIYDSDEFECISPSPRINCEELRLRQRRRSESIRTINGVYKSLPNRKRGKSYVCSYSPSSSSFSSDEERGGQPSPSETAEVAKSEDEDSLVSQSEMRQRNAGRAKNRRTKRTSSFSNCETGSKVEKSDVRASSNVDEKSSQNGKNAEDEIEPKS